MTPELPEHPAELTPLQRLALRNTREFLDSPPTMAVLYRKSLRVYVILALYFGVMIPVLVASELEDLAVLLGGMAAGVILRDFGGFRQFLRIWPASAAVIDRSRLEALLQEPTSPDPDPWRDGA